MNKHPNLMFPRVACVLALSLLAGGCASTSQNPDDPFEPYNRAMFGFNEAVDKAAIKPLARGYDEVAPLPVKSGVGNFFGNVGDIWIGFNNLLQGKAGDAFNDAGRVLINSTVGILGVFDVASELGLEKHDEDFGQTLGVWGVGEGAYFVVPFFGPRTLRDTAVLPIDLAGDNVWAIDSVATRNALTGLRLIHTRAALLGVDKTLEEGTLDKYAYARDFYLQQRRYKVYDGHPPREDFDDLSAADIGAGADAAARAARTLELAFINDETASTGSRP
ncbi:MAG: VacJ family lipoprotein [Rhodocyclaceae bacterium]